ncbi:hypothetical protein D3C81_1462060 [compost metagenome]
MDRIAGIGHQYRVAAIQRGQHQVRQAFLGADGDDGLGIRIDLDVIALAVPVRDRAPQPRDALGRGIAVRVGPLRRIGELGHDMRRRGAIRVAHAHVDDVLATAAGGHLQLGGDVENVRGKTIDAREAALAGGSGSHVESFT